MKAELGYCFARQPNIVVKRLKYGIGCLQVRVPAAPLNKL